MKPPSPSRRKFVLQAAAAAALAGSSPFLKAATRSSREPRRKKEFEACAARLELLGRQFLGVAPEEGRLFHLLIRLRRPRSVLELGTCFGLGTIWMALALEETKGRVTSLEIKTDRAQQARKHLQDFGLERRTDVLEGNAHDLVPQLREKFDFVLLNADKSGYLDYFQRLEPRLLAKDAVLVAVGTARDADKLRPYVETVRSHDLYDSVGMNVIPEDGVLVACRRPA
jgi:predicted O-methyltransferase YrrM